MLDPYTTAADSSDLSEIEISSTSSYDKFEEAEVAGALEKIAECHDKISEGYHE